MKITTKGDEIMRGVRFGKVGKISCLVMLICVFSFSLASAGFYESSLVKITPISGTGDVNVQFDSVNGEWSGTARGTVVASDPGANTIIATLLTALSLGYNVTIQMDNTPAWTPVQVIQSCSVVAP
jgi:hypothetical protein